MGVSAGLYMYDVVVKKFTFAISSPDEFLIDRSTHVYTNTVLLHYAPPPKWNINLNCCSSVCLRVPCSELRKGLF